MEEQTDRKERQRDRQMKFQTDGRQTDRKGNMQTKFQMDGRTDRQKRKTEGQMNFQTDRRQTDRKGIKMGKMMRTDRGQTDSKGSKTEMVMTDGGWKKDTWTDRQNFEKDGKITRVTERKKKK